MSPTIASIVQGQFLLYKNDLFSSVGNVFGLGIFTLASISVVYFLIRTFRSYAGFWLSDEAIEIDMATNGRPSSGDIAYLKGIIPKKIAEAQEVDFWGIGSQFMHPSSDDPFWQQKKGWTPKEVQAHRMDDGSRGYTDFK